MTEHNVDQGKKIELSQAVRSSLLISVIDGSPLNAIDAEEFLSSRLASVSSYYNNTSHKYENSSPLVRVCN